MYEICLYECMYEKRKLYTYTYTYIHIYMYIYIYTYLHTYIYSHTYLDLCIHTNKKYNNKKKLHPVAVASQCFLL
jgi:hypothetical protein